MKELRGQPRPASLGSAMLATLTRCLLARRPPQYLWGEGIPFSAPSAQIRILPESQPRGGAQPHAQRLCGLLLCLPAWSVSSASLPGHHTPPLFLPGMAFGICVFSSLQTHNCEAFGKEVSPALCV